MGKTWMRRRINRRCGYTQTNKSIPFVKVWST
jgi:hypothetical protein